MQFYDDVRSKLSQRQVGFDHIFEYLKKINEPFIVETGCARQLDNYEGDGQSSLLFDKYIKEYGGNFWTVDISEESVNYCKSRMISENSVVNLGDSITKLKKLNTSLIHSGKKIDLLYLDSFDAPQDKPEIVQISALHHLYELLTIIPSLKPGALIGVDDNWIEFRDGQNIISGKGQFIFDYMQKINNNPSLHNYQIFWNY